MPDASGRALHDGRLNLEQQKKRAKELLKGLLSGDAPAAQRLAARHPRGGRLQPTQAQLADAQLVLARENGFDSWPRMKGHTEALKAARAAAKRPELAPDSSTTLHIRCGSDLKSALAKAGFIGAFHEFADPFCQGPVRRLPLAEQVRERAAFVARAYHLYPDTALQRISGEYAALDRLGAYERVVLWFEHDSYDQLILAFLLAHFAGRAVPPVELVCADRVPGVARFNGLGQLAPEVIRLLWRDRRPVTEADLDLGRRAWDALTSPTPEGLFALVQEGTAAIPPMAGALARHLRELPSTATGLGLSQQLTLDVLAEAGPLRAGRLFAAQQAREPLPFLGDTMFWALLADLEADGLIEAPRGAANWHGGWPPRTISLTPRGAAVRSGAKDGLSHATAVRHVGGVVIDPARPCWRWDGSRPVLAPARGA